MRVVRLIMLVGAPVMFACTEPTSPDADAGVDAPALGPAPSQPTTALQTIGASLVDATDWALVAVTDDASRLKMKESIKSLADDLVAGRNAEAKEKSARIRSSLTSFDYLGPAFGPIGIALDQIDSEFSKLEQQ